MAAVAAGRPDGGRLGDAWPAAAPSSIPGCPPYQAVSRRQRQHLEHRLRHAQQPDDALGGDASASSTRTPRSRSRARARPTAPPALIAGTAQLGPMSREMKGTEIDAVREEVRLQADADPHLGRRARGVRQQGQPHQVPEHRPGRRDLLEVAPAGRQGGHQDLGPARPDRRLGQQATQPLRPQLGLRYVRVLQGAHR